MPTRHKAQLPWLSDPAELYQVHLNRERRLIPRDAIRYIPGPANIVETSEVGTVVELREQARTGLMRETSQPGEFAFTFPGAWVATYRLLPPLKRIRLWRAKQRAREDHADALASPAPRPQGVAVTRVSPYAPELTRFPLNYS